MIILSEEETLSREEKFVALSHLYLELQLPLQGATDAAEADLVHLDGSELVAEAEAGAAATRTRLAELEARLIAAARPANRWRTCGSFCVCS